MRAAKLLGGAFGVLAASLALAQLHPFGDPRRDLRHADEPVLQGVSMPDAARRTLITNCADCHSNATRWPLYSWAAPVSWLIERDVVEGRRHLNLSHWGELSADQKEALEQEIVQQVKRGGMPPVPYRLVHRSAHLDMSDRDALSELAPAGDVEAASAAGNADRGRTLFNRRCTGCHALDSNREGPHLRGVYGRRAGSVPGFQYSSALQRSGVTWADASLDKWLTDTDSMVPGNAMGFAVPKAQERSDLIAFLRALR